MVRLLSSVLLLVVVVAWAKAEEESGDFAATPLDWLQGRNAGGSKYWIIHTTDLHGWIAGHRHEASLDTDIGDFVSLISHLRENAAAQGVNLLVVDTGDLIFGTGLSDASKIHGEYIVPIIADVPYDAMTIGNHDMDDSEAITLFHEKLVPAKKDKYLTSNTKWAEDESYFGAAFKIQEFPDGTRALILGYMFDYSRASDPVHTVDLDASFMEKYFEQAMETENIDLVVVLGHIDPLKRTDMMTIFKAVHKRKPDLPFFFLGGHRHITYYKAIDENSFAMESGRYFEVLGSLAFTVDANGAVSDTRQDFLKTSMSNFLRLAKTPNVQAFNTDDGLDIKDRILEAQTELGLNTVLGCSDSFWSRYVPRGTPHSLWDLFMDHIIPEAFIDRSRPNRQSFIANAFSLRDHLYPGDVIVDDMYALVPFLDQPLVYEALPGSLVRSLYASMHVGEPDPDTGIPHFMSSFPEDKIDDEFLIDVSAGQYDAKTIGEHLKTITGEDYVPVEYSSPYNVHEAIRAWVQDSWPCSKPDPEE